MTRGAHTRHMTLSLDGILVADFSRVLAGPLASATLADLGARVIKVERPGRGDDTRSWGPPWTGNSASYFESANRNKDVRIPCEADPSNRELLARHPRPIRTGIRPGA